MEYITISDWAKHQHYKDRRPTWIKLKIDIIEEFDEDGDVKKFYDLPDSAKLTYICLLCLRANYNNKVPYKSEKWLSNRLGIKSVDLNPLVAAGYINIDTDSVPEAYQDGTDSYKKHTPETEREREKERDTDTRIKFGSFQNVKLTEEENQKLKDKFGEFEAKRRIEVLSEGIASKGYRYKSHYATILSWARKEGWKDGDKSDGERPVGPFLQFIRQEHERKASGQLARSTQKVSGPGNSGGGLEGDGGVPKDAYSNGPDPTDADKPDESGQ